MEREGTSDIIATIGGAGLAALLGLTGNVLSFIILPLAVMAGGMAVGAVASGTVLLD